jgi:hypothetical protein
LASSTAFFYVATGPSAAVTRVLRQKVDVWEDFFAPTLDFAKSIGYNRKRRDKKSRRAPLLPPTRLLAVKLKS